MEIADLLLEHGSLGLFAAFLVYLHHGMGKKYDLLIERFQTQIDRLQASQKSEINEIRDRYDNVIGSYNEERTQIRINLAERIAKVDDKVDNLPFDTLQIQIESLNLVQKANQSLLDKGMTIMESWREESKLKEMARKLADKET